MLAHNFTHMTFFYAFQNDLVFTTTKLFAHPEKEGLLMMKKYITRFQRVQILSFLK